MSSFTTLRSLLAALTVSSALIVASCGERLQLIGSAANDGTAGAYDDFTVVPPHGAYGTPARTQALIVSTGEQLLRVSESGATVTLFTAEVGDTITATAARGDLVAVGGRRESSYAVWVALLDRNGGVLFSLFVEEDYRWLGRLEILDDGTLMIHLAGAYTSDEMVARTPTGEVHRIEGYFAQGERWESGLVPLQEPYGAGDGVVLWDARTGESHELAFAPTEQTRWSLWRAAASGAIVYLTDFDGDIRLVAEDLGGARVIDIPDLPELSVTDSHEAGWVLLSAWDQEELVWVDLESGTVRSGPLVLPEDHSRLYAYGGPYIDSHGALLLGMRDAEVGGLYRSIDGATWERIGLSVDGILDVGGRDRAGTYVVYATNQRYDYQEWPAQSAADLSGDSLQLVRPVDGTAITLPLPSFGYCYGMDSYAGVSALSPDGRLAALWHETEPGVMALLRVDARTGGTATLLDGFATDAINNSCSGQPRLVWVR